MTPSLTLRDSFYVVHGTIELDDGDVIDLPKFEIEEYIFW